MSTTGTITGQWPQADGTLHVCERYTLADGSNRVAMYGYADDTVDVDALLSAHVAAVEIDLAEQEASDVLGEN